jgi:hypothetical protein
MKRRKYDQEFNQMVVDLSNSCKDIHAKAS